jgi:hypothetical protein
LEVGAVRRTGFACWLATTIAVLALAGNAAALSGKPLLVGTPFSNQPPSVAVDATGTAYIAWADTANLGGSNNVIQYCVLPAGATACAHTGSLIPADGAVAVDGVNVLVEGSTAIILGDVYGAQGNTAADYEPEQEWQSIDGGATWNPVNSGLSVSNANLNADTGPLNAVIMPGTGVLGFAWETAAGPPTFNAFPLASPPECSKHTCPAGFATLEPNTEPQIGNGGGVFAAQAGSNPGVLGVFGNLGSVVPYACPNVDNIPFVYGAGNQSASNNYNISPGSPGSAWRNALTRGICDAQRPAVGGGPSGFGVLAENEANGTTSYWRFDQTTPGFDIPPVVVSKQAELFPSLSQDGAGGIYATFLNDGAGGPIALSYSSNGGTSWRGPVPLFTGLSGNLDSAVNGAGQGWVTWTNSGQVFAMQFDAADTNPTPTTLTTSQASGITSGASITVGPGTTGETDRATVAGTNAASAGGTVAYVLYSSSSCSSSSKVFDGGTATVTNGLGSSSSPITKALAPGVYYWQATYSGDGLNAPSVSACGSEVLTVNNVSASKTATSTSTTITLTVTCTSTPCTITITITITSGAAADRATDARVKTITLAKSHVKISKRGSHALVVHLSKAGKAYLKAHHGKANAKLTLTEPVRGGTLTHTQTIKIRPGKHSK